MITAQVIQKILYKFIGVIFLLAFFSCTAFFPGCSRKDKHSEIKKRFQKEVEQIVIDYRFPGMTAAYVLPDKTTATFAAGYSDREHNIPMTENSRMLAASIGKTFTAAVILDLVREKKLDLDAPVGNYIGDEEWFSSLPNGSRITLRHLLTHSSGITNHVETPEFIKFVTVRRGNINSALLPEKLISFVLGKPPLFIPGNGFHYSDTGYIIAGWIVEKITKKNIFDEVKSRILNPLDLTMTEPSDRKNLPGLASGYLSPENIFHLPAKTTIKPGMMSWNPGIEWAGGGFVSTSRDLAIWGSALYEGRAISGKYLDDLLHGVQAAPGIKYGIATVIKEDQEDVFYGHKGWIPGYSSSLLYDKNHRTTIAFQINTDIGIIGNNQDVLSIIEKRLVRILFNR